MAAQRILVNRERGTTAAQSLATPRASAWVNTAACADRLVRHQHTFDHLGAHLVAAEIEQRALTPEDDQHAVGLQHTDVAGVEPAAPEHMPPSGGSP